MRSTSKIDYESIGQRLKAYRIAASLRAEDVAENLGISRAAVYRLEKGEIVKIETLDRLAALLYTSTASLLGVDVEYYSSSVGFFERMRQLEQNAKTIYSHFSPFSFLLTSDRYLNYLTEMLHEADETLLHNAQAQQQIATILAILAERKHNFNPQSAKVYNLICLQHIEHFMQLGMVGNLSLQPSSKMARILAARQEVQHLIDLLEDQSNELEIAIVSQVMPSTTFQIFHQHNDRQSLAISPFRLGELPNVTTGIASITASQDAINHHQRLFDELWHKGAKGPQARDLLYKIMARN